MARTDAFRDQHKRALDIVTIIQGSLDPAKLAEGAPAVSENLAKLAGLINMHLSMEDKSLYPSLVNGTNAEAKKVAETFIKEMGNIAQVFTKYVGTWNASTIKKNPTGFITETKAIISVLGDRIRREETELYPLADKA